MEKTYAPVTFEDFFASFEGGMQSGVAPLLLKKNQVGVGINCSVRGGFIQPRPPIQKKTLDYGSDSALQNLVEQGLFQGAQYYRPDFGAESLLAQIAGHLILFTENGAAWTVRDVSVPNDFNDPSGTQVWMWQSEKWMVINDGSGRLPIFFDGATSRRSFGPSQLWGITAADFTPPAIGGTVQLTLTAPYTGQLNVPVILNGEFYQPIAGDTINSYPAQLTNISDTPGTAIASGAQIFFIPQNIGYATISGIIANPADTTQVFFSFDGKLPVIPDGTKITVADNTGKMRTMGIYKNGTTAGNYKSKPLDAIFFIAGKKLVVYASTTQPSIFIGETSAAFTVPAVDASVQVNLGNFYSGTVNQPVWIGNQQYLISPVAPPAPTILLTVINLTDPDTHAVTAPADIVSVPELPAGRMGSYGMGRNWFSLIDGISYEAGDIVGGGSGTPANNYRDAVLKTTENDFLASGGTFRLPGTGDIITAMLFPPILDTSLGQGSLQVGTPFSMFSNNAPADRTVWAALTFPIQTESLKGKGPLAQNSTVLVNSDTFFRSYDGFGSLILARRDFAGNSWGNKTISNEMQRILSRDNQSLLPYGSAITFDNRFLATCAPNVGQQGVFHVGLASLNLDLLSSLRENLPPSWEGAWTGINVMQLVSGRVNGSQRAFAFTFNVNDSKIELYELLPESTAEFQDNGTTPIVWFFETPIGFNGDTKAPTTLCQLRDGEFYLSDIRGSVKVQVYYKPDFYPCWTLWNEASVCSDLNAANANPGYRMRIGLGEPSSDPVEIGNNRPLRNGYFFQFRVVVTGACKWNGMRVRACEVATPVFAPVEQEEAACQTIDCAVPDDLEVYSLQGLPPQPLPFVPSPELKFANETVYFNSACSSGAPVFSGDLPNWISVEAGNNRFVGAAGTIRGATQVAANAAAQHQLNQFVQTNLGNGQITCATCPTFTGTINTPDGINTPTFFIMTNTSAALIGFYDEDYFGVYNLITQNSSFSDLDAYGGGIQGCYAPTTGRFYVSGFDLDFVACLNAVPSEVARITWAGANPNVISGELVFDPSTNCVFFAYVGDFTDPSTHVFIGKIDCVSNGLTSFDTGMAYSVFSATSLTGLFISTGVVWIQTANTFPNPKIYGWQTSDFTVVGNIQLSNVGKYAGNQASETFPASCFNSTRLFIANNNTEGRELIVVNTGTLLVQQVVNLTALGLVNDSNPSTFGVWLDSGKIYCLDYFGNLAVLDASTLAAIGTCDLSANIDGGSTCIGIQDGKMYATNFNGPNYTISVFDIP